MIQLPNPNQNIENSAEVGTARTREGADRLAFTLHTLCTVLLPQTEAQALLPETSSRQLSMNSAPPGGPAAAQAPPQSQNQNSEPLGLAGLLFCPHRPSGPTLPRGGNREGDEGSM